MAHNRCAEYDANPTCAAPREHRRFCIDRDEYVAEGAESPLVDQSWTTAKELCESHGKRLCFESEWQFACEGEKLLPYPYGLKRNAKLCNHDLTDLEYQGKLRDKRVRPADRPGCVSPLGSAQHGRKRGRVGVPGRHADAVARGAARWMVARRTQQLRRVDDGSRRVLLRQADRRALLCQRALKRTCAQRRATVFISRV